MVNNRGGKRLGSGRKTLSGGQTGKSKQLSVTLENSLIEWCKTQNVSASEYIRQLITIDRENRRG